MREVAAAAEVTVGLIVHHFGSKKGLREAVEELIVSYFDSAIRHAPYSDSPRQLAEERDAAVADMLRNNPAVVGYIRRTLLDSGEETTLLQKLTDLTRLQIASLRTSGAASQDRADSKQTMFVIINQLGKLILQPTVDAVWGYLHDSADNSSARRNPHISVRVSFPDLAVSDSNSPERREDA